MGGKNMKDTKVLTDNGVDLQKSLELFGDMATYDQMLEDFLREVGGKLENARKYKEDGDMPNYAIVVHSLKSDCKYFGMFALADKFYEHELAGKKNDYFFVTNNFDSLVNETNHMVGVLKRYMGIEVQEELAGNNTVSAEPVVGANGKQIILVVDDSNIIRNFIQKIFEGKYEVKLANDGEEAISIIGNTPKSQMACMFLDLNMPNVDGFQVLEYFKNSNLFSEIPVSIITGIDDKETIDRAFTYPIVDMIKKPFNEASIKNVAIKTISQKK